MPLDLSDWKRRGLRAGFTEDEINFLAEGIPHTHGPKSVFIEPDKDLDLDEWSSSVEERLAEVTEDGSTT